MEGDAASQRTYERFVAFERLVSVYPRRDLIGINARPIGYCAFALTFFVYSMIMTGATVPQPTPPSGAMGLALFYGGLVQLVAGIFEYEQGNNFYGLQFCSYAGYFLGLGSLYVTGSFSFFVASSASSLFNTQLNIADFTLQEKSIAIFYLGWTIFTLCMLIASIRTDVLTIIYFFFLMLTFTLWTADKYLTTSYTIQTAGGAIGIFTAVLAWLLGFANLLRRGENSYFTLPLFSLEPKKQSSWANQIPPDVQSTKRK